MIKKQIVFEGKNNQIISSTYLSIKCYFLGKHTYQEYYTI